MKSAFLLILICQNAFAVSVYRFPEGRFSSGEVPKERLRPTGEIRNFSWLKTSYEGKEFWLSRDSVATSLDLSTRGIATVSTPYYSQPFVVAKPKGYFKDLTKVELISRRENWFKIAFKIKGQKRQAWIPENLIQSDPHDKGDGLTQFPTVLKAQPTSDSKTLLTIPEATHLLPIGLKNSWVKVRYKNKTGWVSLYKILSKLSFARQVQKIGSHNLVDVTSVSGNWFTLADNSMISLDQVVALETNPFIVLVTQKIARGLDQPSSTFGKTVETLGFGQILPSERVYDVVWVRAGDGEGNGVWYRPQPLPTDPGVALARTYSFADLRNRGIYDMALDPKDSRKRFVSAHGIFKTEDGTHWIQVMQFENTNSPVAVSESGEVYVGSHVSHNGGETFAPYLKWDNVIGKIVRARGHVPENLRLIKVACNREKLIITLGFGIRNSLAIQLFSKDHGRHWTYGSSKTPLKFGFSPRRAAPSVFAGLPY